MGDRTPAIAGGSPTFDVPIGYGGQSVGQAEKDAVVEVLESDYITRGPTVDAFEDRVANLVGVDHAIALTSGTAALHLVGDAVFDEGDDVITSPLTFAATAFAASYAGARPAFADVNRQTRNIDPASVRDAITGETTGLVPVHYAGQPCDIEELTTIADENDLTMVWDACHAIGSTWRGAMIGSQRDVSVFSFHPVKTITTGEGGMVVTDNEEIAADVRSLRSFRMETDPPGHRDEPWYQEVTGLGYNYNFSDIQAALGLAQLDRLSEFKERRTDLVHGYDEALSDVSGIRTPAVKDDVDPAWHLYAIEVDEAEFGCSRKQFVNAMHAENIGVQVHYVPLHFHDFFQREYGYKRGDFPVTEAIYDRLVSLPLYPAMTDEDREAVVRAIARLHEYYT